MPINVAWRYRIGQNLYDGPCDCQSIKAGIGMCPNKTLAAQLYEEFSLFSPKIKFVILSAITIITSLNLTCQRRISIFPKRLKLIARSSGCALRQRPLLSIALIRLWWPRSLRSTLLVIPRIIARRHSRFLWAKK